MTETMTLVQRVRSVIGKALYYPPVPVGHDVYLERLAWVEARLQEIPAGQRLLDAGAGEQYFKKACGHLSYVAQDFAQYDGKGDAKGIHPGKWDQTRLDIVSDICAIPVPDGSFDAVLCSEVLEHLPDPGKALRELARVVRTGGRLIVTAPFCSLTHFSPYHYASGFNRYYYEKVLGELGFTIRRLDHYGSFFHYVAQELRRVREVARTYSGTELGVWPRWLIHRVLTVLQRLSEKDSGSAELLVLGYLVVAEKTG
jgi:ubiquinone/menaquinone biosynthesis C-methylase UbiE